MSRAGASGVSGAAGGAAAGPDSEDLLGKALDRTLLKRVLSHAWRYRLSLAGIVALLPLANLCELAQPFILKTAIDDHISVGRVAGLDALGLAYLAALAGQYGLLSLQTYLMQKVGQQAMNDLRVRLYKHVMGLAQAFFDRTPVGRLMTRLTSDIEALTEMFASGLISLVADVIKLAMILATIFALDSRLALFSLATAPILFLIAALFRRLVRDAFRDIRTRLARLNAFVHEHLAGVRIVQAFARERSAARRFDDLNRDYRRANTRAINADSALYAIVEAVGSFAVAGLLWHGGARIFAGTLSFGVLVAFIEYLQKFFAPIRDLSTKYTVMQQAMASAERVFALLDTDQPDAPPPRTPAAAARAGDAPLVRFENVSFAYRPDAPVLRGVSIDVMRGQTVAVVGATGAGKSTLIKLLARFHEPDAGDIFVGGRRIADIPVAELRRRIVVVGQDPFIFSGTLGEAIGLDRTDDAGIRDALRRSGAALLIEKRPLGLATAVAPRGANFSAGERQLIALARALACNPEVLVLDEATANVDPETERLIERGTAELMRGRTALVIAHRLSTIADADRIVVIDAGRVVEQGTQAELLAAGGIFAGLHRLQTGISDGRDARKPGIAAAAAGAPLQTPEPGQESAARRDP